MSQRFVSVPAGYRCPLCENHVDTEFEQSRILGVPICAGCAIEISILIEQDERPEHRVLDGIERITGLTFPEYQKLGFEEFIEDFESRLRPENIDAEVNLQRRFTCQTKDQVVEGWQNLINDYRERIRMLEDRLTAGEG